MSDELWRWTAEALAAGIRTGAISSREATESCLTRLDAVNPRLNAIVDNLAEEAIASADRADKAIRRGAALGILHGVPVTIKIIIPDNGSSLNAHGTSKAPTPDTVSRGIGGIQLATVTTCSRCSAPSSCTNARTDNSSDPPIVEQATAPAIGLLK